MHFARLFTTLIVILSLFAFVVSAEEGFTDYIVAITKPVTDEKIKKARADVKAAGGKIIYEIKTGSRGLIVSLPDEHVSALDNKDYVEYMERDQEVHAY
ncbi:hypothetical protein J3Q64DRAFT_1094290 [Phycomyces blakesleeanus]|uniref:Inhibitor I9 domain-containing protein n=1 Tax=Phycomyces blakesleeanus TaxID=4837 RepID=A0ABR3BH95_PHYBL